MPLTDLSKLPNFISWVEALESGQFQQIREALRSTSDCAMVPLYLDLSAGVHGYCCLGVATELANRAGIEPILGTDDVFACEDEPDHKHDLWCVDRSDEILAPEVATWLGLDPDTERNPELYWGPQSEAASLINDRGGDFWVIARGLRAKYLEPEAPQDF